MRIGINANYFQKPATGIGVVTTQFMHALASLPEQLAHEWIWYYEGEVPTGEWPKNWQFKKVKTFWRRDDLLHRFLWERFALPQAVQRDGCDQFFSLYQSATIFPAEIMHSMFVHDLIPKRFPEYLANIRQRLYYRAIERGIASAERIICPSVATKDDLVALCARSETEISVAPLGINSVFQRILGAEERDEILSRYGLKPGYLYHGGGFEKRKNTEAVLRAYAKLKQNKIEVSLPRLVMTGTVHARSNPLATSVQQLITELGLEDDVVLLGWVPETDLPALYQGASVFLFPSRYEGFGLPVLEAFASITPVITTAAGSLAELAKDAAIVIEPDDVDGIAHSIRSLLSDSALRERLKAAGQERAGEYSWERFGTIVVSTLVQ